MAALTVALFDMDGVLVDVSRSYRRAIEETVQHFTRQPIPPGTIQHYKNRGGFNDDWLLTHAIVADSGIEGSLSQVTEVFQGLYRGEHWDGFIADESPLMTLAVLDEFRAMGLELGVVTGRPLAEAEWTLERLGWRSRFSVLVAREHYGSRGKPDPFPLQYALDQLQTTPGQAVYIGDTVDDMVAARAAGVGAIGSIPPYLDSEAHREVLRQRGAQAVVDSPDQLTAVVKGWKGGGDAETIENA